MRNEKTISAAWAFGLSFLVSLSAVMCMVSAFDMGINVTALVLCLFLSSLVCSLCYTLPLGLVPPGIGAVLLGGLWRSGSLVLSLEALLNRLTRQYDSAYRWGIIRWGLRTADQMEPTMLAMLCILGTAIAMAVSWAVCRRRTVLPGILLSLLCAATCFVVTDTVPDTVWLYFLLLGTVTLMLTGAVRRQDAVQGNRLCAFLAPITALALLVLLAAVPQQNYHGQATAERLTNLFLHTDPLDLLLGQGNILAGSDSVDLTTVGNRVESKTEVMTVTAEFDGTLYLRGRTMNTYDGRNWADSGTDSAPDWTMLNWPNEYLTDAGTVTITTRYAHRMLYMPYYSNVAQMRESPAGRVNQDQLTEYSFACKRLVESDLAALYPLDDMWSPAHSDWTPELLTQFITLPRLVSNWAKPLAEKITGGVTNPYLRANAIAAYVRNSATYNTNTPRMPAKERNFVRWFLEESDTGYCVHFASAAAVLLQASGIPARYVTGYMVQVKAGQATPVQAAQSHAWVEYWLPGFGWTVLEATPADLTEPGQTETTTETAAPDATEQTESQPTDQPEQDRTPDHDAALTSLLWVAAGLGLVGIALAQRSLRLWLRQRRRNRGTRNQQAVARWLETVELARLLHEMPDRELFELAQMARYSQYDITEAELARFDAYETAAQKKLRKRSVLHRLYYRLILAVY